MGQVESVEQEHLVTLCVFCDEAIFPEVGLCLDVSRLRGRHPALEAEDRAEQAGVRGAAPVTTVQDSPSRVSRKQASELRVLGGAESAAPHGEGPHRETLPGAWRDFRVAPEASHTEAVLSFQEHAGAQSEDESLPHGGSRGCS